MSACALHITGQVYPPFVIAGKRNAWLVGLAHQGPAIASKLAETKPAVHFAVLVV
jgi:hypothetical protein